MKQTISEIISDLVLNLKTYVNSKIDLYLLTCFEKIGKLFASLLSSIILVLIFFFCLLFITIALALWLGDKLNNLAEGFLLIGAFYFILGLIFIIFKKSLIDKKVIKNLLKSLFNHKKNNSL